MWLTLLTDERPHDQKLAAAREETENSPGARLNLTSSVASSTKFSFARGHGGLDQRAQLQRVSAHNILLGKRS